MAKLQEVAVTTACKKHNHVSNSVMHLQKKLKRHGVSEKTLNWSRSPQKRESPSPSFTVAKCQIWKWVLYALEETDGLRGGVRPGWKVSTRLKQSLVCPNNPSIDPPWRSGQRTGRIEEGRVQWPLILSTRVSALCMIELLCREDSFRCTVVNCTVARRH